MLELARTASPDVKARLTENALEDAVAAFDGYGREHCSQVSPKLSFQNIASARDKLLRDINVDIRTSIDDPAWEFVCDQFQKRHLLAHKMGVMDAEYVLKTGKPSEMVGRKITITEEDVSTLIDHLQVVASNLYAAVAKH